MFEILYLTKFILFQSFGFFIALAVGGIFIFWVLYRLHSLKMATLLFLFFFGIMLFVFAPKAFPDKFQYPFALKTYGPADGPELPLKNVIAFFQNFKNMENVSDIARNPNDLPGAISNRNPALIEYAITAKEVISEMAPGVYMNYWTFDGKVPGPFLRVREGDTVQLTLKNDPTSLHHHSIDLHAVTGPGGGAAATNVAPGQSKTFTFRALNPGLFVYHCAHPNVANHMAHGMYGLILVEPKNGLLKVDKEFYVMQGEFYPTGALGDKGLQVMSAEKLLKGAPEYIVFNGRIGGAVNDLNAKVGETVRIFFGNGGVNFISSFHVIGEIFDKVYPEAAMGSEPHLNVQTTAVPAGGATIVEFETQVPGKYILVDHALSRLDRGAWGVITVDGEENKEIFDGEKDDDHSGH